MHISDARIVSADGSLFGFAGSKITIFIYFNPILPSKTVQKQFKNGSKFSQSEITSMSSSTRLCGVSGWTNITQIAVSPYHTVELTSDGRVCATGKNEHGECDVSSWSDVVYIGAGKNNTVGIKSDGSLLLAGQGGYFGTYDSGYSSIGPSRFQTSKWGNLVRVYVSEYWIIEIKYYTDSILCGIINLIKYMIPLWIRLLPSHIYNLCIAVEKMQKATVGQYDLILMDIQMPTMNGYDATRAIRALPNAYTSGIPIIAMTANAFDEDISNCKKAGMDAHLAKPIDIQKLLKTLSEILV